MEETKKMYYVRVMNEDSPPDEMGVIELLESAMLVKAKSKDDWAIVEAFFPDYEKSKVISEYMDVKKVISTEMTIEQFRARNDYYLIAGSNFCSAKKHLKELEDEIFKVSHHKMLDQLFSGNVKMVFNNNKKHGHE